MAGQTLKDAYELIKAGDKALARPIIMAHIKANPTDYKGWWVLANAVDREEQRFKALEKVLAIKPDFQPARQMMDEISSTGLDAVYRTPPASKRKSKSDNNNLAMIVGVVAVVTLLACGGVIFVVQRAMDNFTAALVDELSEYENYEFEDYSYSEAGSSLSSHGNTIITQGSIGIGDSKNSNVGTFDDDGWIFNGNAGQTVTIEASARNDILDPQLYVYSPSGSLIAENDDIDVGRLNFDSRVTISLPESGGYTIVVSAYDAGGPYRLSVRR